MSSVDPRRLAQLGVLRDEYDSTPNDCGGAGGVHYFDEDPACEECGYTCSELEEDLRADLARVTAERDAAIAAAGHPAIRRLFTERVLRELVRDCLGRIRDLLDGDNVRINANAKDLIERARALGVE